jgi:hypothetical protein
MTFDLLGKDDMFRRRPPSSGLSTIISAFTNYLQLIVFYIVTISGSLCVYITDGRRFYEIK